MNIPGIHTRVWMWLNVKTTTPTTVCYSNNMGFWVQTDIGCEVYDNEFFLRCRNHNNGFRPPLKVVPPTLMGEFRAQGTVFIKKNIKSWKTSAVSTTVWMVEIQLCKLRWKTSAVSTTDGWLKLNFATVPPTQLLTVGCSPAAGNQVRQLRQTAQKTA